jgi:hypothetical protein
VRGGDAVLTLSPSPTLLSHSWSASHALFSDMSERPEFYAVARQEKEGYGRASSMNKSSHNRI